MEEAAIAVHVQGLTKRYSASKDERPALNNINLDIPIGKIWCLLGPNGSGKTTLLKTLAGLLSPTEGTVSILGIDTSADPMEARKKIGWMPAEERGGFYGRLTAKENLSFFAALQGVSKEDEDRVVGNLAFLLDFNEELDKMMLKISAGGRQKIGLARTLLHEPSLLLLDEPMRNLDPHAVLRYRRLLKDHLARNGHKTVLLSTHQLEEARRLADHVVIINEGEIVQSLTVAELEHELKNRSLEDFYMKTIDKAKKDA